MSLTCLRCGIDLHRNHTAQPCELARPETVKRPTLCEVVCVGVRSSRVNLAQALNPGRQPLCTFPHLGPYKRSPATGRCRDRADYLYSLLCLFQHAVHICLAANDDSRGLSISVANFTTLLPATLRSPSCTFVTCYPGSRSISRLPSRIILSSKRPRPPRSEILQLHSDTHISIHLLGSSHRAQTRVIQFAALVLEKDEGRGEAGLLQGRECAEGRSDRAEGGAQHAGD